MKKAIVLFSIFALSLCALAHINGGERVIYPQQTGGPGGRDTGVIPAYFPEVTYDDEAETLTVTDFDGCSKFTMYLIDSSGIALVAAVVTPSSPSIYVGTLTSDTYTVRLKTTLGATYDGELNI